MILDLVFHNGNLIEQRNNEKQELFQLYYNVSHRKRNCNTSNRRASLEFCLNVKIHSFIHFFVPLFVQRSGNDISFNESLFALEKNPLFHTIRKCVPILMWSCMIFILVYVFVCEFVSLCLCLHKIKLNSV